MDITATQVAESEEATEQNTIYMVVSPLVRFVREAHKNVCVSEEKEGVSVKDKDTSRYTEAC